MELDPENKELRLVFTTTMLERDFWVGVTEYLRVKSLVEKELSTLPENDKVALMG